MTSSCQQHSTNTAALFLCGFALLLTSCARTPPKRDPAAYAKEIEQWRGDRIAELKGETGWLTLIGLFWLKPGENKFGSDPKNDVVLSRDKVGAFVGTLSLENGAVRLRAQPNSGITVDDKPVISLDLQSDEHGKPTVMHLGSLSLTIIKRGDKIVFAFNGQTYRLDALTEEGEKRFFMIIADQTSGKDTYPAGRYLYVDPPDSSGRVVIDFNKAYSPPCAFTKFATCPLPPRQNRLPFAIEAGEKYSRQLH